MNVFRKGDVVYTPDMNGGTLRVGESYETGIYAVQDTDHARHNSRWYPLSNVSFEPWPDPVHKRPWTDGAYMISNAPYNDAVYWRFEGNWYSSQNKKRFTMITLPSTIKTLDEADKWRISIE